MKRLTLLFAFALVLGSLFASPSVTNVTASQRTDTSMLVDIHYDLYYSQGGEMTVMLMASNDGGASFEIPCNLVTGDVGQHIWSGTNKHIVWNVAGEYPNIAGQNFKFKVIAFGGTISPIPEEFVMVQGGTFTMGNTLGGGSTNELPLHEVTLSSYLIGRYEVTQSKWVQTMGSNPASGYGVGDNYPVYYVSWYAILKYCNLRSMEEGLTPVYTISGSTNPADWGSVPTSNNSTWDAALCNWSANGYRLPTEAEWEYAARGGTTAPDYIYSGSDNINEVAWYSSNSGSTSHEVGLLDYNGLSLYDMSGNIWEWCWDWYGSYSSDGVVNPTGPETGSSRLLRGGYWGSGAAYCRVTFRSGGSPCIGYYSYGFRLCRAISN